MNTYVGWVRETVTRYRHYTVEAETLSLAVELMTNGETLEVHVPPNATSEVVDRHVIEMFSSEPSSPRPQPKD